MKIIIHPKNGDVLDARSGMYPSLLEVIAHTSKGYEASDCATRYGYVIDGEVHVKLDKGALRLTAGAFFCESGSIGLAAHHGTVAVITRYGFRGQCVAGRIENRGRLSYIDGCSDSMLVYPPRLGDPVLNYLHFPESIEQSQHTHPSIRMGVIASGRGEAFGPRAQLAHVKVWDRSSAMPEELQAIKETDRHWIVPLVPGAVFLLEEQEMHSFRTSADDGMDVIAFHPDSDWGPTDQNHPMLNKTYIGADVARHTSS